MTDRVVLIDMLRRAEVVFREDGDDVEVHANDQAGRGYGYRGFFTVFVFDPAGALEGVCPYE